MWSMPAPAWERHQGAKTALVVSRSTTVPISPHKNNFLSLLGSVEWTPHFSHFFEPAPSTPNPTGGQPTHSLLKRRTCVYTPGFRFSRLRVRGCACEEEGMALPVVCSWRLIHWILGLIVWQSCVHSAVAQLLMAMSVDRVVTVDLHCGQIQGSSTPVHVAPVQP